MERDNRHEFFTCTDIRLKDRHQIDKELEIAKDDRKKIFKIGESNEKKLAKLSGEVSELKTALAQKDKQIENLIGEVTKSNSLIVKLASEIQRLCGPVSICNNSNNDSCSNSSQPSPSDLPRTTSNSSSNSKKTLISNETHSRQAINRETPKNVTMKPFPLSHNAWPSLSNNSNNDNSNNNNVWQTVKTKRQKPWSNLNVITNPLHGHKTGANEPPFLRQSQPTNYAFAAKQASPSLSAFSSQNQNPKNTPILPPSPSNLRKTQKVFIYHDSNVNLVTGKGIRDLGIFDFFRNYLNLCVGLKISSGNQSELCSFLRKNPDVPKN